MSRIYRRIYICTELATQTQRLIVANSRAQALRYLAAPQFVIDRASTQAVADLMTRGAVLEEVPTNSGDDEQDTQVSIPETTE